jgi:chromosome segregation ATPase
MTENDKLKREVNEQRIKCQDLEKSLQTYKPQIEALRQENDNLSHARDVDSSLISRRDRKIEELKADLAMEKQRRENAETLARQREREKEDAEEHGRREMQQMTESTKHATVHAEILETSHKQLSAEYRARAEAWKTDLGQLSEGREHDRQKLARLDVVSDQMRQELERSRKLNGEILEKWDSLKAEVDTQLKGVEEETYRENDKTRQLSVEMDKVVNEMRWLIGVKNNIRDADQG